MEVSTNLDITVLYFIQSKTFSNEMCLVTFTSTRCMTVSKINYYNSNN